MKVYLCDAEGCDQERVFSILIQDGEYQGLDFDACSLEHASMYFAGLLAESDEEVVA